ncbi:phage tail protein [Streptomyces sp. NPDC049555]|uniref:phage tail tube protein n=1 Tax=Streptomyces sp. NPDC049555 TaxID=3154930 RepID=UPI00341A3F91
MIQISRAADLAMVGANGGAWVAPVNTPGPIALGTPPAPWTGLGAISDDGLKYGFDEDHKEFTPWGVTSAFRTQITKSVRTFGITMWETNSPIVKSLMFRIPVNDLAPGADGITRFAETASPAPDRRAWYFLVADGDTMEGFYVPSGEITDRSDVTYKSEDMAGYDVKITAYPDGHNNTVYHTFSVKVPAVDPAPPTPPAPKS